MNHVTEKTIQSCGHKVKLLKVKYVDDNQRTHGALWYMGCWHMPHIGNYTQKSAFIPKPLVQKMKNETNKDTKLQS